MTMSKLRRRVTTGIAATCLAVAGLVVAPQAAQAYATGTQYSADGGAKVDGSISFSNAWSYSANWKTQDFRSDGRTPYLTVKVWGNPYGTSNYYNTVLRSQTFSTPYAFGNYNTYFNNHPARIYTVEVKMCNGGASSWCTTKLYDNPYT